MDGDHDANGIEAPLLPLEELATELGHGAWLERRCFEVTGAMVRPTPEPRVKLLLAELSRRHGWHFQVLFDRLPVVAHLDPESLVVAPGASEEALFDSAAGQLDPSASVERLTAVHDLLAVLIGRHQGLLDRTSPVSAGSVQRWLGVLLSDSRSDQRRAADVLTGLRER